RNVVGSRLCGSRPGYRKSYLVFRKGLVPAAGCNTAALARGERPWLAVTKAIVRKQRSGSYRTGTGLSRRPPKRSCGFHDPALAPDLETTAKSRRPGLCLVKELLVEMGSRLLADAPRRLGISKFR